ncbi:TIGR00341 family protein [Aurantiacibacter sp. MUD11]|uniref:TIGR00341 family protein n=1 Tax=Aurantiacibacter sp. MUD11 TaxID=3003265 RepID=UPI0022AA988C|nr:TIGR00341 family protein [Aurantiacibacter sp. MUD11]WAT17484.1 TIGR00341 family protein [Aurantiacibacter sp. MUD11]
MQTEPNTASNTAATQAADGFRNVLTTFRDWWRKDVMSTVDQVAVIEKRRAECELSARYLLMVCMSAGIAVLGLLQGSAAVVIGAMLLSPLMDPIMGVGFALAVGDYRWLRQSGKSLAVGVLFAILFTALVVALSPLQTITAEIAARTRPTLFDLAVAFFSSVAGAYAMIRGREGTIVGVAIATALMPPLAVVGFGLATLNGTVFWGSLFLFITNLTAIALTATAMARIYGFSTSLSEKQTQVQGILIFVAFVVLAIPLFLSLRQIVWETQATRQANNVVIEVFDRRATISQLEPSFDTSPMRVTATVLTPQIVGDAERRAAERMTRQLGRPVEVSLTQLRVGTSAQAQEEAQLARARAQEAAALAQAEDIAERLALLAGVPTEAVTVDRERRRALVTARPLDGATLYAYAELERRIDATEPEWDIRLTPPLRPLPAVSFEAAQPAEGEEAADPPFVMNAQGRQAVALIAWAQTRVGMPLQITGPADAVGAVRVALSTHSIAAQEVVTGPGYGPVQVTWSTGE